MKCLRDTDCEPLEDIKGQEWSKIWTSVAGFDHNTGRSNLVGGKFAEASDFVKT